MDINEAKNQISKEFISRYTQWLEDHNSSDLSDRDYGYKYGWGRFSTAQRDTQKSMLWFQSHIYSGRYAGGWKSDYGFERRDLVDLHRDGFLSYDYCSSWKARNLGKTDYYYISQTTAKEIYKAYKAGTM